MTRKSILLALASLLAAALCLLAGCPAPGALDSAAADPDAAGRAIPDTMYIAGRCANSVGTYNACYWNGTSRVDLNGYGAMAVSVSAGMVYTAGAYMGGTYTQPCYWRGTSRVVLPSGDAHGIAYSIFVTGGKVYTAGYYRNGWYRPCIWTDDNGSISRNDLPATDNRAAYAMSIYVSGTTTYVAGFYDNSNGRSIARLWTSLGRGGSYVDLSTDSSEATSVFLYGGYAYIGGSYDSGAGNVACFWKWQGNEIGQTVSLTRTDLPGADAYVSSLTVNGGRIIAAGLTDGKACYWANGRRTDLLPENSSVGRSVCVSGGKIYTAGWYVNNSGNHACVWEGTVRTDLPDKGGRSFAYGIR